MWKQGRLMSDWLSAQNIWSFCYPNKQFMKPKASINWKRMATVRRLRYWFEYSVTTRIKVSFHPTPVRSWNFIKELTKALLLMCQCSTQFYECAIPFPSWNLKLSFFYDSLKLKLLCSVYIRLKQSCNLYQYALQTNKSKALLHSGNQFADAWFPSENGAARLLAVFNKTVLVY